jgi:hypothetical protein
MKKKPNVLEYKDQGEDNNVLYLNQVKLVTKEGCKCVLGALMHAPSVKGDCNVLPDKPSCASGHFGVEFFFMAENCSCPTRPAIATYRRKLATRGNWRTDGS